MAAVSLVGALDAFTIILYKINRQEGVAGGNA